MLNLTRTWGYTVSGNGDSVHSRQIHCEPYRGRESLEDMI